MGSTTLSSHALNSILVVVFWLAMTVGQFGRSFLFHFLATALFFMLSVGPYWIAAVFILRFLTQPAFLERHAGTLGLGMVPGTVVGLFYGAAVGLLVIQDLHSISNYDIYACFGSVLLGGLLGRAFERKRPSRETTFFLGLGSHAANALFIMILSLFPRSGLTHVAFYGRVVTLLLRPIYLAGMAPLWIAAVFIIRSRAQPAVLEPLAQWLRRAIPDLPPAQPPAPPSPPVAAVSPAPARAQPKPSAPTSTAAPQQPPPRRPAPSMTPISPAPEKDQPRPAVPAVPPAALKARFTIARRHLMIALTALAVVALMTAVGPSVWRHYRFQVTEVSVKVAPERYDGPCPVTINFSGTITVRETGTVRYRWLRSDGAIAPEETLLFDQPGSKSVSTGGRMGPFGFAISGWQAIKILSPNQFESPRAAFELVCR